MDEVGSPPTEARRRIRRVPVVVVVATVCVLVVLVAVFGYGRWKSSTVADDDLVMVVRHSQVVDVLAPGMTTARVDVTVQNPTSVPLTVSEASLGGFAQTVSTMLDAHGSADLSLHVQVACSDRPRLLPMVATLTVAKSGGPAQVLSVRMVEDGTADALLAQCRQKVYGS
jgi:hypothetical protein